MRRLISTPSNTQDPGAKTPGRKFPHGTNSTYTMRRDTLSTWKAVGILLVLLAGIFLTFFVSRPRGVEGNYETKVMGERL